MMTDLADLSASEVQQAELTLVQMLQDLYPSMDLSRGRVFRELVIRPAAMFHILNNTQMEELRKSSSLLEISQNPSLATDDIVDNALSNLLLTRDTGAAASGQLRIIITSPVVTAIDSDMTFTANGLQFNATRAFVGVTSSANLVNSSQRGNWPFW